MKDEIRGFAALTDMIRRNSLRALMLASVSTSCLLINTGMARADCSPAATLGDDTVICDGSPDPAGGDFIAADGDDSVTITAGNHGTISGSFGTDTITVTGGTVASIQGDFASSSAFAISPAGSDVIDLLGGTVTGNVLGLQFDDTITLDGSVVQGSIYGGISPDLGAITTYFLNNFNNGANTFILTSGSVAGGVFGENGADTFTLNGATITGVLDGAGGDDTFTLTSGSAGSVQGGDGADTITLDGATIAGTIDGGADADTINLLAGSAQMVLGGTGDDIITLDGATITPGVTNGIYAGEGADTIVLNSGSTDVANGGNGNDTITLDGATIAEQIDGGADADTINLLSGSADIAQGGRGTDTITLDGATINLIDGGDDADIIILDSGSANLVFGNLGVDVITINGGSHGIISGHADADTITFNNGTVQEIQGDYGIGFSTLISPVGDDIINLLGGTVTGDVLGHQLNDTITLDGTAVLGNIYGGFDPARLASLGSLYNRLGENTFILTSGSVGGGVFGEDGADTFTLNGAAITGNLEGGAGNDDFTLTSGSVASVLGGTGSDTLALDGFDLTGLAGALDGGDDTAIADGFIDTLTFNTSGIISGAQLLNWEIINLTAGQTLNLTGPGLTTSSDLGYGFSVAGGSALIFGGDFTLTGNLTNAGVLDLSGVAATTGDIVTVTGEFGGAGTLYLDVDLDAMTSDRLVVNGTISGNHAITLNNLTPASEGGPTGTGAGNGIVLVDNSAGPGVTDGQFTLSSGPIAAGAYVYNLSAESDGILYLQSLLLGEAAAYGVIGEVLRDRFPSLRERLGERMVSKDGTDVWATISGERREIRPDASNPLNGGDWDENRRDIAVGLDFQPFDLGDGSAIWGGSLHVTSADATTFASDLTTGQGNVSAEGVGLGVSLAWFGDAGVYVDLQGRVTRWDISAGSGVTTGEARGDSFGLSVELGQRLSFGERGVLTPRAQIIWSESRHGAFTDSDGLEVEAGRTERLIVNSGLTYEQTLASGASLFADIGIFRNFGDSSGAVSGGETVLSGASESWATLALGASMPFDGGGSAYLAARGTQSIGNGAGQDRAVGLEAGLRLSF